MNFQPIARSSLREDIVAELRSAIMKGALTAGERVYEGKIAEQMNVSRVPVREALLLLEQEGLVNRISGKGVFVTKLTNAELHEFYTFRSVIEEFAIELAMKSATPEDISQLQDQIQLMQSPGVRDEKAKLFEADLGFHRLVAMASHHNLLIQFWRQIVGLLQAQFVTLLPVFYPMREDIVRRHQLLLDAMLGNDVERAQRAIRDHVVGSGEALMQEAHRHGLIGE